MTWPQWVVTEHAAVYSVTSDFRIVPQILRPKPPFTKADFMKEIGCLVKARAMTSDPIEVTVIEAQLILCARYYGRAK